MYDAMLAAVAAETLKAEHYDEWKWTEYAYVCVGEGQSSEINVVLYTDSSKGQNHCFVKLSFR